MGAGVGVVSQKVFLKWVCKSQFLHESVNLFFVRVTTEEKLKDLSWN